MSYEDRESFQSWSDFLSDQLPLEKEEDEEYTFDIAKELYDLVTDVYITDSTNLGKVSHCMFDGLEPGVYGLVCPCPRCSPSCF